MNLNRNSFWNRFEHFQEESKSPLVRSNNEELHIFIKFKEYQINRKIGALRKKRQTDFLELNFSNQQWVKKAYSENEISNAVIKSLVPDLALRAYLEGKDNLNLKTMSSILRSRFKEPNATSLFTGLSNSQQLLPESA